MDRAAIAEAAPIAATRTAAEPRGTVRKLVAAVAHHATWQLPPGLVLVTGVQLVLGPFLAMQAYFGATFYLATGAVVGVGLARTLGNMVGAFTMAGVLAGSLLLSGRPGAPIRVAAEAGAATIQGRTVGRWRLDGPAGRVRRARRIDEAGLVLSGGLVGVALSVWGVVVGTGAGCLVAQSQLGVAYPVFFAMLGEMLWPKDLWSLVAKGFLLGMAAAALVVRERSAARREDPARRTPRTTRALRAVVGTTLAIVGLNAAWFLVLYQGSPAFGPTVLPPPVP